MVLKIIISKKDFQADGDGVQWTFVSLYENDKYKKYLLPALKDIVYLLNVTCLCRNFRCNKKNSFSCFSAFEIAFCYVAVVQYGRWVAANTNLSAVTPGSQSLFLHLCLNCELLIAVIISYWKLGGGGLRQQPSNAQKPFLVESAREAPFLRAVMLGGGVSERRGGVGRMGWIRTSLRSCCGIMFLASLPHCIYSHL